MTTLIVLATIAVIAAAVLPAVQLWYRRNRCPKCGAWHTLTYVTEVVTDKAVGHDRNRYGTGGGYGRNTFGGIGTSHTSDQPFIREWVEERYICQHCGRHVSVHTKRDKR